MLKMHRKPSLLLKMLAALCLLCITGEALAVVLPTHTVTRVKDIFVADGTNTEEEGESEYSDSLDRVELGGSDYITARVFYQRYRDPDSQEEELRVYFSVQDTQPDKDDSIKFYFDRRHDGGDFGDPELEEDVLITTTRGIENCSNEDCEFRIIHRGSTGAFDGSGEEMEDLTNVSILRHNPGEYAGVPGFGEGWTGEFVLTPAHLGWSHFPRSVGHLVEVVSANQNAISDSNPLPGSPPSPTASYPLEGTDPASPVNADAWASFKLSYPIDYALSLDFSGSMRNTDGLDQDRWTRAKRAADLFVTVLGLMKDDRFDDRVSVSQYSWPCSEGDNTGPVPGIGHSPDNIDIPDPPTGGDSFTEGNDEDPQHDYCTPIKAGIDFLLAEQLGIEDSPELKRDRIAVMMSDGFHNRPSGVEFDPTRDFDSEEKDFTQLRTVAMGPTGTVGEDLLAEIATEFKGGDFYSHEARYNHVDNFPDLVEAYLETLQLPLTINQVTKEGDHYAPGAPDKLVLLAVWDLPPEEVPELEITVDGSPETPDDSYVNNHIGYAAAVFNDPPADGEWTLNVAGGEPPTREFVLADLRILSRFLVEQKPYAAGESMLLRVNLKDQGEPLLDADVSVEISKPDEGLGNYLSTVQEDCEPGSPALPGKLAGMTPADFRKSRQQPPLSRASASAQSSSLSSDGGDDVIPPGEPVPGRYGLAAKHFARCGLEGLPHGDLPGIALNDDGVDGDLRANDGIYSLRFTGTDTEGSYTLRFFARGETADGMSFSRMRTLSQYVGVEAAVAETESQLHAGPDVNGLPTVWVSFLPRDDQGNYVGPGYANRFEFSVTGGQLVEDTIDLNNGYYLQMVQYPEAGPEPEVTIRTERCCFQQLVGEDDPDEPELDELHKWLLLVVIILLILLLVCWVRRRVRH